MGDIVYPKEREGDKCPAGRYVVAQFLFGVHKPKDTFDKEKLPEECLVVNKYMCKDCPDRGTMWIDSDGNMTIQCKYLENKE